MSAAASSIEQDYPRFSAQEYARRRAALAGLMQKQEVDHLLLVTEQRCGDSPQWLTGWPGTVEALALFRPDENIVMHVERCSHVPLAQRIARDVDVQWGEHRGIEKTMAQLARRGARRIGLIGPLGARKLEALEAAFQVELLDAHYADLRLVKSDEEIQWLRMGAALSDAGFSALLGEMRPGLSERELASLVERACVGRGCTTCIHYIGATPMAEPQLCVPPQYPSSRRVRKGDAVICDISACWWGYPGQVLRSFTVDADPAPLYARLHDAAEAAFDAVCGVLRAGCTTRELLEAAQLIEERGFTMCDELVQGPAGGLPEMVLQENMTIVVRPNVVTPDMKAGVQVGELLRVTRSGFERLHGVPRGFFRVDGAARTPLLPDGIV